MTVKFAPVPPARLRSTKSEIIRDVEFYYPHLQGPLKRMFDDYVGNISAGTGFDTEHGAEVPDLPVVKSSCPHCGSTFVVE